jgi:hypothetical protein
MSANQEDLEMFVPSYQMHNVLNVYSKKLRHNITSKDQNMSKNPPSDRVDLTSEGKRRTTIEKISKDIFDKIIRFGSQSDSPHRGSDQIKGIADKEIAATKTNKAGFVYNVIDTINKKTTNTVPVEDSRYLIHRLEQLSKDTMDIQKQNTGLEAQGKDDDPIL